jgi:putative zinc finger/helix-turn-helix YgiT family protein
MVAKSALSKSSKCPACGHSSLVLRHVDETFEYGADNETVLVRVRRVPVEVCKNCGESYSGPEAAAVRHRAICKALGLLTPEQIRSIREGLGLTQARFAALTGIGEATVSRWERGRLVQSKALDRYLRLLASHPDNIRFLEQVTPI